MSYSLCQRCVNKLGLVAFFQGVCVHECEKKSYGTSDVEKLVISMYRLQKKNARGELNVSVLKS